MKCSVCGSENLIKINEQKINNHNIETYCCKDCYHIDQYCFDFKKKDTIINKAKVILNNIKTYRINGTKNKKEALILFYNALINIHEYIKDDQLNDLLTNISLAKNELEMYYIVETMLSKQDEQGYDDKGNPLIKEVYYIEDFPINYEDCVSGKNGLFFYLSKAKYRDLDSVKNHTSETTVLDILDEYYKKEALNHKVFDLNENLKNEGWYLSSLNINELKNSIDDINKAIELYNK